MLDRTLIALAAGVAAGLVVLVGSWLILTAYALVGWQVPVAAGFAVFAALWVVDWLTDALEKRS